MRPAGEDGASRAAVSCRPCRLRILSRGALVRLAILGVAIALTLVIAHRVLLVMPGASHSGALPEATDRETRFAESMAADVQILAGDLGPRNRDHPIAYSRAADFIEQRLRESGHEPNRQPSPAHSPGASPGNIIVEVRGASSGATEEILVVGAHYDSFDDSPGANDNATGVAAVLALAESFAGTQPQRTIRFAFFADEEPPWFQSEEMGSRTYARACRTAGDRIVGMLSLETMGWYSDEPGSQRYPAPLGALYPDRGDFIGFVSNPASRAFLREVIGAFRETTAFPSEGAALPSVLPGISWSDHWSFWQEGYPGLMITDTAPFRYPWYHTPEDTPDKVDALRLARVVLGIERVLMRLTGAERAEPAIDAEPAAGAEPAPRDSP